MIALARCAISDRIVVAGAKSVEIVFDLQRRGFARTAASANCGRPAGQYDVALVDWRQRTFQALETTLEWLADFLSPAGVVVVWVDSQKPAGMLSLRTALERRGFSVDEERRRDDGCLVSARRSGVRLLPKAA